MYSVVARYIRKLRKGTLKHLYIYGRDFEQFDATEVIGCLISHSSDIRHVYFSNIHLSDELGIKLAQFISTSSTVTLFNLSYTQCSTKTYLAVANALCVNSSIITLLMVANNDVDVLWVITLFVHVLRLNPCRSINSRWQFTSTRTHFALSNRIAAKSTAPSMLEFLLCVHQEFKIKPKIRYFIVIQKNIGFIVANFAMSAGQTIDRVIQRLQDRDATLKNIALYINFDNSKIEKLIECLVYNKSLKHITFMNIDISDVFGAKIIQYVACSSKLDFLSLSHNKLTETTAIALADALCVNASLRVIYLHNNCFKYSLRIDVAFVNALRLNPRDSLYAHRHHDFKWCIYTNANEYGWYMSAYSRLKVIAEKSAPPSMLEFLLRTHLISDVITPKIH